MFWICSLALMMAAALVKLGVAVVMISILTSALWVTGACLALLLAFVLWQSLRQ
jgi:hypothetical protein